MNCKNCGNPLTETEKFCNVCGTPVEAPAVTPEVMPQAPAEPVMPTEPMMANNMMDNQNMMMNNQNPMMDNQNMMMNNQNQMMNNQNMMMNNQNMMMNNQNQMPDNNVNNNMPPQQPKKSNAGLIIIIILLVLAIGVGGFLGGYYLFGGDAETSEKDKDDDKEDKDDEEDEDEDEDDEKPSSDDGTPIKVGGEVIIIPDEYDVNLDDNGGVQITNGEWVAAIAENTITYDQTVASITLLKDEFQKRGFEVKKARETKVNGNDYVEFVLETAQYNMAVLIADYKGTCIMVTIIASDLQTLNDKWYKDIDEILENSKSVDKNLYPDLEDLPSLDITDTVE